MPAPDDFSEFDAPQDFSEFGPAEPEKPQPEPSIFEKAQKLSRAALPFGDEIVGLIGKAMGDKYGDWRDAYRSDVEQTNKEYPTSAPVANFVGKVGTGLLVPGGFAGALGAGAASEIDDSTADLTQMSPGGVAAELGSNAVTGASKGALAYALPYALPFARDAMSLFAQMPAMARDAVGRGATQSLASGIGGVAGFANGGPIGGIAGAAVGRRVNPAIDKLAKFGEWVGNIGRGKAPTVPQEPTALDWLDRYGPAVETAPDPITAKPMSTPKPEVQPEIPEWARSKSSGTTQIAPAKDVTPDYGYDPAAESELSQFLRQDEIRSPKTAKIDMPTKAERAFKGEPEPDLGMTSVEPMATREAEAAAKARALNPEKYKADKVARDWRNIENIRNDAPLEQYDRYSDTEFLRQMYPDDSNFWPMGMRRK